MLKRALVVAYLTAFFSIIAVAPAHAYIDTGSGSIIFQALAGAAMAAGLFVKVFWRRIKSFFSRKKDTQSLP